jgi:hypothetical protein
MKVTLNIKLVNPEYSQALADKEYGGKESEDNIRFLWEDEFDVEGAVKEFKVVNNTTYTLAGEFPDGKTFSYEIPDMTIIHCHLDNGELVQFPISGKLIQKTEKKTDKVGNIIFRILLKGVKEMVSPMTGTYFLKSDFPEALLEFVNEEEEEEEEEVEEEENGDEQE